MTLPSEDTGKCPIEPYEMDVMPLYPLGDEHEGTVFDICSVVLQHPHMSCGSHKHTHTCMHPGTACAHAHASMHTHMHVLLHMHTQEHTHTHFSRDVLLFQKLL